jgi:tagatose 1,6-diphosphate aldolase
MAKKELTIGKFRGLQQISDGQGVFTMLALDQRGSLLRTLNPEHPEAVTYQQVVDFKLAVSRALASHASALLVDPIYGAPQAIASGVLPGQTGLLVSLEQTGYTGESHARRSVFIPFWSVAKIKHMGASAVKFLLYYHPQSGTAGYQEDLLQQAAAACREHDIPLLLECLSYPIQPGMSKDSAEFAATKPSVVIETARRLCPMGVDVFKAEFPADMRFETDKEKMVGWCRELTQAAGIPWVLLSAAVDYEFFYQQVEMACQGGASGFLAGRSIWQEALGLRGDARTAFLNGEATHRLHQLINIAQAYARPWTDWYEATVTEGWHERY